MTRRALGLAFALYTAHEESYLSIAVAARLNGWELDRLMYNFQEEFIREGMKTTACNKALHPTNAAADDSGPWLP